MQRSLYAASLEVFCQTLPDTILGHVERHFPFAAEPTQRNAWLQEIEILQPLCQNLQGCIHFEFAIPRMGKYVDVVLVTAAVIFVLEFKIGECLFPSHAIDQVWDYALDLKNFHETSHDAYVVPILISTEALPSPLSQINWTQGDRLLAPLRVNSGGLGTAIDAVLKSIPVHSLDPLVWEKGRYSPTPTIIEAAMALYRGHSVAEISRSDSGAINLHATSETLCKIICDSRNQRRKSVCFVTGVPGAGKTLVGLNIATQHQDKSKDLYSVFLSGNGPLVAVLREALARDKISRRGNGTRMSKKAAMSEVQMFIQNVHHFRDDCLVDMTTPPIEHVAIFDEAQRAWNLEQTSKFMRQKKGMAGFQQSEPEYLLSCLNRHSDWATVICLVGGGQEINTGEAGIKEWFASIVRSFKDWDVYVSPNLQEADFLADEAMRPLSEQVRVFRREELHLRVSMRSFRSEAVSKFVGEILEREIQAARKTLREIRENYPIVLTRNLKKAKAWLREKARGSERYGIMVSSEAQRLKPYAIDVRSQIDPVHWFLDGKEDVRSSYYLEDVGTEFQVQGLELDWGCVTWDGDFRYSAQGWEHWSFCGDRWNRILKDYRRVYQKNAYRVLLTRARQGMVIVVPEGDPQDPTRNPMFYDPTFEYLQDLGMEVL